METGNLRKGIISGILADIFIGFQPIVANGRPDIIDPYIYAALTVFFEALVFFPIMFIQRENIKKKHNNSIIDHQEFSSLMDGYKNKKNIFLLLIVGLVFGVGQILFFIGYDLAGSINGAIAQKSTIFFSLLFGYLLQKEKITKLQIIFSFFLFFGLILAVTEGSFNLIQINLGVIVLIFLTCMWMLAHTLTKPLFQKKEAIPSQVVVIRNLIGAIILFSIFSIFLPIRFLNILINPIFLFWGFSMGLVYSTGLFFWYKTLSYLDVSKASILVSPTPIVTAIFATILLGELFTIWHLLGMIFVITSIVIIMVQK
ncbi:MAG: EamA family transporter [Candidatus Lokiarchaeota archaeon]|nr:EamA family transporter [Candidatus Lokiarchaeota archaeon]MBD3201098.1 EamA family transporter [Candidatus Lokiarchaeota archaeon]